MNNQSKALSLNEEFEKLWNTVVARRLNSGAEIKAKSERPYRQQLLAAMISWTHFPNPQETLVGLIGTIEAEKILPMKPTYPLIVAMETFEVVFQAAPVAARRGAWGEIAQRVADLSPDVFERLSSTALKDKLLAQKENQVGLDTNDPTFKI